MSSSQAAESVIEYSLAEYMLEAHSWSTVVRGELKRSDSEVIEVGAMSEEYCPIETLGSDSAEESTPKYCELDVVRSDGVCQ